MWVYTEKISDYDSLYNILHSIKPNISTNVQIERFHDDKENDRTYDVYKVEDGSKTYVLKKSDKYEMRIYERYLNGRKLPAPFMKGYINDDNGKWILVEFLEGNDLRNFTEEMAYGCAKALSKIHKAYWEEEPFKENEPYKRFDRYWREINKRMASLKNEEKLSKAYKIFLQRQINCPRTLCNGDFLQCNAIYNDGNVKIIDWSLGGFLPYSLDIAKFVIGGSEEKVPFSMSQKCKNIFINQYYKYMNLSIPYERFIYDIELSCMNECIEFIEEKLNDNGFESDDAFKYFYEKASELAESILEWNKKI